MAMEAVVECEYIISPPEVDPEVPKGIHRPLGRSSCRDLADMLSDLQLERMTIVTINQVRLKRSSMKISISYTMIPPLKDASRFIMR